MRFTPLPIPGAFIIDMEPHVDHRGTFARAWCAREFAAHGIDTRIVQVNTSFNHRRGTLRGMHYQIAPHGEPKTIRCTRGAVFDVLVDLRPDSPTYLRWHGEELTAENRRTLHIPALCAHGFLTLADDSELLYFAGGWHAPAAARGVRHDDPGIGIEWPIPVVAISDQDRAWPLLAQDGENLR